MRDTYREIDVDRERVCCGCGSGTNLTHSHIISRKDKELMADKRNITYHCANIAGECGCSFIWEQVGLRASLLDYIANLEYIKEVRYYGFRKMIVDDYYFLKKKVNEKVAKEENYDYICCEFKKL